MMIHHRFSRSASTARGLWLRKECVAVLALALTAGVGHAQSGEPFVGETRLFATSWCPKNWAVAAGQLLSIAQNSALFSLLGTTYGGNGTQTFALPDLRGRAPTGQGEGPGLSSKVMGEVSGTESLSLNVTQMPPHSHRQIATNTPATQASPAGNRMLAQMQNGGLYAPDDAATRLTTQTSGMGAGLSVDRRNPYLTMTWCIALYGIFPPSN